MKLLVYGLNYAPELIGVGKYTHEMSEWLASRGHLIKVITSYPHYPDWNVPQPYKNYRYSHENINGVDVIRCPVYVPKKPSGLRRLTSHISFAASSAPVAVGIALRFRPDVLFTIAPSQMIAPAALLAARVSGAHSWLHIQDFEIEAAFGLGILSGKRRRQLAERLERASLRRFDRVSTISPKMMERLIAKQLSPAQIYEFRNWVDTSTIRPEPGPNSYRAELGLPTTATVALYSGSMALKQGLETLVEAARTLRGRSDIVFVFCGKGAMRDRLVEQSRDLENIRFLDLQPSERLSELLSMADVHLLPQRADVADLVLPSKLAPMLASGRPIVAMAKSGTQISIEVEGAGLVIPADDPSSLVSALVKLADDPSLRARLGVKGRIAAQSDWDVQTIMSRLEDNLMALADRAKPPASPKGKSL